MSLIKMAKQIADLALKSIGKGNTVQGLTLNQTKMLLQALAKRESGGDYTAENSYGYLGAYQFGAAALVDVGLIQKDKYAEQLRQNRVLPVVQMLFSTELFWQTQRIGY
ncbi:hypothetical protein [Actinobacillus pleuropneumoniae]|uniref:hypothetical protein n=1 Tax=Actinobacillus pleuropneumoniae TaxID=715 RepID=UPI003F7CB9A3